MIETVNYCGQDYRRVTDDAGNTVYQYRVGGQWYNLPFNLVLFKAIDDLIRRK